MPALSEIASPSSLRDASRIAATALPIANSPVAAPPVSTQPGLNPVLRCPIPPIWQTTPDSLRQFYNTGGVPQMRMFTPPINSSTSGTVINNNYASNIASVASGGGGGGGGGGGSTTTLSVSQTVMQTTLMPPGRTFVGSLTMSRVFQLLSVATNGACRMQLYGTALAQTGDFARDMDVPLQAGVVQDVITDLVLDTSPYQWDFQDRVGANNDSPPTSRVYITITNLSVAPATVTITLSYVVIA
jgi:hypothetical protein